MLELKKDFKTLVAYKDPLIKSIILFNFEYMYDFPHIYIL